MKKFAGIYSLVIGFSIIILWSILLLSDQVPELTTEPASIYMHMAAELIMAIMMIVSGILLVKDQKNAIRSFTLSSGLLTYSVINSSGYYIENNNISMVIVFAVILIFTLVVLKKLLITSK